MLRQSPEMLVVGLGACVHLEAVLMQLQGHACSACCWAWSCWFPRLCSCHLEHALRDAC